MSYCCMDSNYLWIINVLWCRQLCTSMLLGSAFCIQALELNLWQSIKDSKKCSVTLEYRLKDDNKTKSSTIKTRHDTELIKYPNSIVGEPCRNSPAPPNSCIYNSNAHRPRGHVAAWFTTVSRRNELTQNLYYTVSCDKIPTKEQDTQNMSSRVISDQDFSSCIKETRCCMK